MSVSSVSLKNLPQNGHWKSAYSIIIASFATEESSFAITKSESEIGANLIFPISLLSLQKWAQN